MHDYVLNFAEYCWSSLVASAPEGTGIYCAYSCNRVGTQLIVDRLLYIGQTDNFRRRFSEHLDSEKFKDVIGEGKLLFFTWAKLDGRSLDACEAAMVYRFQPPLNEKLKDTYSGHVTTTVTIQGKWAFGISGSFTQEPTK